jgi:hypothetical protein
MLVDETRIGGVVRLVQVDETALREDAHKERRLVDDQGIGTPVRVAR